MSGTPARSAVAAGLRAGRPVFASGGDDGTIRFWDPVTGRTTGEPITAGRVFGLVFVDGVLVTSGEVDGGGSILRRWDPVTGEAIGEPLWRTESGLGQPVSAVLDGRGLVAVSADGHLRVWDVASGEPHTTMPWPAALEAVDVLDGRLVALTGSAPDEDLFSDAEECHAQETIWDVAAAVPLFPPMVVFAESGSGTLGRVAGRLVAAHGVDAGDHEETWWEGETEICLRDLSTGELFTTHHRPEEGGNRRLLIARVHGRDVVVCVATDLVVMWDVVADTESEPTRGLCGQITGVAVLDADGRAFGAAGDVGHGVRIWEIVR